MPSPTQRQGARHEQVAEEELVRRGYTIVERNLRTRRGELDRIAEDEGVLVFVEIRSRSSVRHGRPGESVGHKKQRSVVRAAAEYLAGQPGSSARDCRFDVVEVVEDGAGVPIEIAVIAGAFDASVLGRALVV
jgi:putative endonuclease